MFCYNCGCKLETHMKFCYNCAAPQNTAGEKKPPANDGGYDKEALRIYLSNIQMLECILNRFNRDISALNNDIESLRYYYKRFELSNDGYRPVYIWLCYDGMKTYIDFYSVNSSSPDFHINTYNEVRNNWIPIDGNLKYLRNSSNWHPAVTNHSATKSGIQEEEARDKFLMLYPSFMAYAPQAYKDNEAKMHELKIIRDAIEKEMHEAAELLKNAYDLNIIPQHFRNIYAVYFLYDFISTSNESLTTAMLHCDLDSIKQKLDTVIDKQVELILGQAVIASQNEKLMMQNRATLYHLANIEQNTSVSAQYAKMAENHLATLNWIARSDHFDRMYVRKDIIR